jgi:hypothetical protein
VKKLFKHKKLVSISLGTLLASLGSLVVSYPSQAFTVIDSFDSNGGQGDQSIFDFPPLNGTSNSGTATYTPGSGIAVGDSRDLNTFLSSGNNVVSATTGASSSPSDRLTWSAFNNAASRQTAVWDGPGGGFGAVNTTGLGGINLTTGGVVDLVASVVNVDSNLPGGSTLTFTVWDMDGTIATSTYTFPANPTVGNILFPFVGFTPTGGSVAGIDFTNIGAIQFQGLLLNNPTNSYNISFDLVAAGVPFEFSPALGILSLGAWFGLNRLKKNSNSSNLLKVSSDKNKIA